MWPENLFTLSRLCCLLSVVACPGSGWNYLYRTNARSVQYFEESSVVNDSIKFLYLVSLWSKLQFVWSLNRKVPVLYSPALFIPLCFSLSVSLFLTQYLVHVCTVCKAVWFCKFLNLTKCEPYMATAHRRDDKG